MNRQLHFEEIDLDEMFGSPDIEDEENPNFHQLFMSNYASKSFKFWVMHANFNLTAKVLRNIADVNGIERIIPITRYRALINFGYLFDTADVQKNIMNIISKVFYNKELRRKSPKTQIEKPPTE